MVEFTKMGGEVLDRGLYAECSQATSWRETDMVDGRRRGQLPRRRVREYGYVEKQINHSLHPAYHAARRR
ncbi:MAG: hypothetical protein ACLUW6_01325 [Coriobacteriaceae bacterium]